MCVCLVSCLGSSAGGANTLSGLGDLEAGCLGWVPFTCLAGFQQRSGFLLGYLSLIGFATFSVAWFCLVW